MISINPSRDVEPKDIAQALSAYPQGGLLFKSAPGTYGPFQDSSDKWQLDSSNDFWLSADGDALKLSCRYPAQDNVVTIMGELLKARGLAEATEQ